ncbi:MAG: cytidylate kinase-like family protein [Isosphaeraceae bacterium]
MSTADPSPANPSGPTPSRRLPWPLPWDWTRGLVRWLEGRESRIGAGEAPTEPRPRFRNLCISREAGTGSGTIARLVGEKLGWKVYEHELIDAIARRMEVPIEQARGYDELAPSVIQDWILPMREEHYAPHEAYLDHLAKLVEAIGKTGQSIIVGRGAGFLLPREETLSVRIVAPLKFRAQRLADRYGVSYRTAKRAAREQDRRFLKFARVMYRIDAADPHEYDLVLDSHSLGLPICGEILLKAIEAGMPPASGLPSMGGATRAVADGPADLFGS